VRGDGDLGAGMVLGAVATVVVLITLAGVFVAGYKLGHAQAAQSTPKPAEAPACVCRCEPAPCRMEGPHAP
jgi:hypothetical protein